jgi:hypothetical protein
MPIDHLAARAQHAGAARATRRRRDDRQPPPRRARARRPRPTLCRSPRRTRTPFLLTLLEAHGLLLIARHGGEGAGEMHPPTEPWWSCSAIQPRHLRFSQRRRLTSRSRETVNGGHLMAMHLAPTRAGSRGPAPAGARAARRATDRAPRLAFAHLLCAMRGSCRGPPRRAALCTSGVPADGQQRELGARRRRRPAPSRRGLERLGPPASREAGQRRSDLARLETQARPAAGAEPHDAEIVGMCIDPRPVDAEAPRDLRGVDELTPR